MWWADTVFEWAWTVTQLKAKRASALEGFLVGVSRKLPERFDDGLNPALWSALFLFFPSSTPTLT